MAHRYQLTVLTLISCLTISQFVGAQTLQIQPKKNATINRSAKVVANKQQVAAAKVNSATTKSQKSVTAISVPAEGESTMNYENLNNRTEGIQGSPLMITPGAAEFLFSTEVGSTSTKGSEKVQSIGNLGQQIMVDVSSSNLNTKVRGSYGISKSLSLGVGIEHSVEKSDLEAKAGFFSSKSSSESTGLKGMEVFGVYKLAFGATTLLGEANYAPAIEKATIERDGTKSKSNGAREAAEVSLRSAMSHELRSIRLLGVMTYQRTMDGTTKYTSNALMTDLETNKDTGAYDTYRVGAGFELPSLLNIGLMASYGKDGERTSKTSYSDGSTKSSKVLGTGTAIATTYVSIPLASMGQLIPTLQYATVVDRPSDSQSSLESLSAFSFGLKADFKF